MGNNFQKINLCNEIRATLKPSGSIIDCQYRGISWNRATCVIKLLSFLCVLAPHGASRRALEPQWRLPPCFPPGACLRSQRTCLRSLWGASGSLRWSSGELGTSGEPLGSLLRTSREPPGNLWEASGEPFGNPCGLGLWKALQLGKVCLCNGLHKIN